jgi:enoyl-CoA hydratase/carnithine racemase
MSPTVTANAEQGVFAIRLEGPGGNALTNGDLNDLRKAFQAAARSDCAVVTIQGAGDDFCAGRDHASVEAHGPELQTPERIAGRVTRPVLDAFEALDAIRVPVVAAVQGRAWGLSCALASACDVTLVADDVSMRLPEMLRELPPTLAMSQLHRVIPYKRLFDLVTRSPEFGGDDAVAFGIATEVVPKTELGPRFADLVADLLKHDPLSLATVKTFLRTAPSLDTARTADMASALLSGVLASQAGRALAT